MTTPPEDPLGLEQEIGEHQRQLAATVDELAARVAPKAVARRGLAAAQARARDVVLDQRGRLRTERVAALGGAVAALGALIGLLSWGRHRRRSAS